MGAPFCRGMASPHSPVTIIARSPQSFEKRQRERRKQMKRQEKLERRQVRTEEKKADEDRPRGPKVVEMETFDDEDKPPQVAP